MKFEVRIFAGMADTMGNRDSISIELDDASIVTSRLLRETIEEVYPEIAPLAARSRVVVNETYVADDHVLGSSDRLALIPPVSGG
ncbi:MAG: MoaD/ThiS family protein [Planctomycetota bacterium]